jgi:ketosteroid isomerase-like protein
VFFVAGPALRNNQVVDATADIELVTRLWESVQAGDLDALEAVLAPGARWIPAVEGWAECPDRRTILEVMRRNRSQGAMRGELAELIPHGDRLVAGFRPGRTVPNERPLDDGIAYIVVTVRDGVITELKGCADRAAALSYAESSAS